MATIQSDSTGAVARILATAAQEDAWPTPPAGGTALQFDEISNAALLADLLANQGNYALVAGVLKKAGVTVTVAADSGAAVDRKAVLANQAALFAALRAGTAPGAQVQRVLAFLLRQFLQG